MNSHESKFAFAGCCIGQLRIIGGLLLYTVMNLPGSRDFFFKLRFACSFLSVIPVGDLIFFMNAVWLVCCASVDHTLCFFESP